MTVPAETPRVDRLDFVAYVAVEHSTYDNCQPHLDYWDAEEGAENTAQVVTYTHPHGKRLAEHVCDHCLHTFLLELRRRDCFDVTVLVPVEEAEEAA